VFQVVKVTEIYMSQNETSMYVCAS